MIGVLSASDNLAKPKDSIRETCALCGRRSDFKYRFSQDYFGEKIIVIQCADPGCNWLVGIVSATPDHQWYLNRANEYKEKYGDGQVEQEPEAEPVRQETINSVFSKFIKPKQPEPVTSGQLSLF